MANARKSMKTLPRFSSVEEEAAFWDTHSSADYEWEVLELEIAPALEHVLSVRLDQQTFHKLSAIARKKGIGVSTLARMWVLECLALSEDPRDSATQKRASAD
jgi:hypothetical protein